MKMVCVTLGILAGSMAVADMPTPAEKVWCTVGKTPFPTYPFSDPDPIPAVESTRYPYFRYDGSTAVAKTQAWTTVVLENGKIRVTLLPEIGGKVWGATDKATGTDFVYYNHVVKFRDIAMRGPWCSGGIEFNFGIIGHAPSSSTPVDWCVRTNADASVSYFASSAEYVTRAWWQVEVCLRPGADHFETRTTWYNNSGLEQPYYHWMNAAYSLKGDPRFLFPGKTYIGHDGDAHAWPRDAAGHRLDVYSGNAFGGPKSYHVLPGANGVYGIWWPDAKVGSYHRSDSYEKYGRKVWLWALSREGGIWEDLLTDTDGQYTELQSGRCFNQPRYGNYRTPFKHPVFGPGRTETFVERWGVFHDEKALADDMAAADTLEPRPFEAPEDFDWQSAWGHAVRGRQYLLERHDAEAETEFRAAVAKDRFLSPAWNGLAAIELRRCRYAETHECCRKSLAIDAYDAAANYLDGAAYFLEGRGVSARDRLGVASFSAEYRTAALSRIARSYLREGKMAEALSAAEKALAANALDLDATLVRLVARRGTPEAKALADEVLTRLPLFHAARYERAQATGEDFAVYVTNELTAETWIELANWYEHSGLAEDAARLYAQAGNHPMALVRLAKLRAETGDAAGARQALDKAKGLSVAGVFPFRGESVAPLKWAVDTDGHWKFRYLYGVLLASFNMGGPRSVAAGVADATERVPPELLAGCDAADEPVFYQFRAKFEEGAAHLADLNRAKALGDSWRLGRQFVEHYLATSNHVALLATTTDYLRRYPDCNPMQIAHGNALVLNGRYDDCLDYLRNVKLLPSEHRDSGTDIWQAAERGLDPDRAVTWPENLGKGRPYSATVSACDEPRAYEFARAGRSMGDHEPLVGFEREDDVWTVETAGGSVAKTRRTKDYQLFGDWTLRLVYRAEPGAKAPVVKLRAAKPVVLPADFDTATTWIRGTRFGFGANRDPETPSVKIVLDFKTADGREVSLPFTTVVWKNWFLVDRRFSTEEQKTLRGGTFLGFTLTGGTQTSDRLLHFDDICFFREKLDPIALKPRTKRNMKPLENADQGLNTGTGTLPFPTREETIQPDGALDTPAADEPLPAFTGGTLDPSEAGALRVKTERRGRTLVVDLVADAGKVKAVRLGVPTEGRVIRSFAVPYLAGRGGSDAAVKVDLLEIPGKAKPYFRLAMFDWYRSNAGDVQSRSVGNSLEVILAYPPKTDGKRNAVSERIFITLSPKFEDVLPNIPNPPSPWKHVAGRKVWRAQAAFDREHDRTLWRALHTAGFRELNVCDHETMWRKGGESFTLKTEADPSKGGDAAQRDFTRFMIDELGYRYGLYNNYTDFAPSCPYWTRDWVPRQSDGSFKTAWMRCYAMRPAAAPEANERIAPEVQRKFGFNTAYNDVHTAVTPWSRTDYDARIPGAGTMSEVLFAWGEVMLQQKATWKGPVWSEGGSQFMLAGLADGNYAQDWGYKPETEPWLPDFDLRKIHPLECDFGMGCLPMFAPGKTALEKQLYLPNAPTESALTNLVDRFICATLAHGHTGYLILDYLWTPSKVFGPAYGQPGAKLEFSPRGMSIAMRSYFMTQQIAARYSQCEVKDIRYFDAAGRAQDTSAALASDVWTRSQLALVYTDGTVIVANGNPCEPLDVTFAGERVRLPPNGYRAWTADRSVVVDSSCGTDGVRADSCDSPAYVYLDGRGKIAMRARARADGAVAMWPTEKGCEVCAVPGVTWSLKFPAKAARAVALDGSDLGPAEVVRTGEWFTVCPVKGAWAYRIVSGTKVSD